MCTGVFQHLEMYNLAMECKPAIASMSLGRAWIHGFNEKVSQAAKAGFKGIEIFYEDLEYLAKAHAEKKGHSDSQAPAEEFLLSAAEEIRQNCDDADLTIICMQPFIFYEGLIDRKEHQARIEKLIVWFKIVKIFGTDLIQIPSNFQSEGITGDLNVIVEDMRKVADLGLQESPPVRFAYENLAWGTFVSEWQVLWDIVCKVDRPNFGCCLDAFNIAGRVWADPATPDGKTPNADKDLEATLAELVKTIDLKKVFYIQVVDAERLEQPLLKGHPFYVEDQPARMSWSRNARLFPFEYDKGAYLPVIDVAKAFIHGLGYRGWISFELFSRTMSEPGSDVPYQHAQRAWTSWTKFAKELDLES